MIPQMMASQMAGNMTAGDNKINIVFKIIIYGIIIFIVWQIVKIFLNIVKPIQRITESEEDKESRQNIPEADFLSPFTFTKFFKKEPKIKKHLAKYGLSYGAINQIVDDLWKNGFGWISDNERYIYQKIRTIPTLSIVSMLSYNLKKRYKMGLDELIDRNLSADEKEIILNILKKKPQT